MKIELEGGKYTYCAHHDGRQVALRHGEYWRDLCGDKFIYCLAASHEAIRTERDALAAEVERLRGVVSRSREELDDINDWTLTEKAPLRQQELDSITGVIALSDAALEAQSNAIAILARHDAETLRKAAALIDNIEVEQTNHCMNVYEEGERYKQDAIEAIKRMADELEANAKEEK